MSTDLMPNSQTSEVSRKTSGTVRTHEGTNSKLKSSNVKGQTSKQRRDVGQSAKGRVHASGKGQKSIPTGDAVADGNDCGCHGEGGRCLNSPSEPTRCQMSRSQVILSCSHIFHQTCLEAFEEFASEGRRFICPVCRSHYQKRVV